MSHECVLGLLHDHDLHKSDIKERLENEADGWNRHANTLNWVDTKKVRKSDYTALGFLDRRQSSPVRMFLHCPYCGLMINWNSVKELFK